MLLTSSLPNINLSRHEPKQLRMEYLASNARTIAVRPIEVAVIGVSIHKLMITFSVAGSTTT